MSVDEKDLELNSVDEDSAIDDTTGSKENGIAEDRKKLRSPMSYAQRFLVRMLIIIVIIWLMFGIIFGIAIMPNGDMYPRIDSGDMLLYFRLDRNARAQDIVVFSKNNTEYVGRVVAVEGDTVDVLDDSRLSINGKVVTESNIFYSTPRYQGFVQYPVTLSENEYFVLVDSREKGEDSRYFGPITGDDIKGTVITLVRRSNL